MEEQLTLCDEQKIALKIQTQLVKKSLEQKSENEQMKYKIDNLIFKLYYKWSKISKKWDILFHCQNFRSTDRR